MFTRTRKSDILIAFIIGLLLALPISVQWVYSWTGSTNTIAPGAWEIDDLNVTSELYWNSLNRTDTLAYPEQAASYIIFISGNKYYAKNGITSQIDYSGTNATTVIQSVIDTLTSGGYLFFKAGTFNLSTYLTHDASNIVFKGLGASITIFNYSGAGISGYAIRPADSTTSRQRVMFRDLAVVSNIANIGGISLQTVNLGEVRNCYIGNSEGGTLSTQTARIGIYLHPGTAASGYFNQIINTDIQKMFKGIEIASNINQIINGRVRINYIGINIESGSDTSISNVDFEGNSYGFRVGAPNSYNHLYGGYYESNSIKDIIVASATAKVDAYGIPTGLTFSITSGAIFKVYAQAYVNSGTQTCADNENIAHGLAGTPTFVDVNPMNDTYDGVPLIATVDWSGVDATNIRIGLYWVNGTAISDDVILVSWKAEYTP